MAWGFDETVNNGIDLWHSPAELENDVSDISWLLTLGSISAREA